MTSRVSEFENENRIIEVEKNSAIETDDDLEIDEDLEIENLLWENAYSVSKYASTFQ